MGERVRPFYRKEGGILLLHPEDCNRGARAIREGEGFDILFAWRV